MKGKIILFSTMFFMIIYSSCGGGGDGGDTPVTPAPAPVTPSIEYTGINQIVTLSQDNTMQITIEAVNGGELNPNSIGFASFNYLAEPHPQIDLVNSMREFSKNLKLYSNNYAISAVQTESEIDYGNCGGEANYTLNIDESSPNGFWGAVSFVNYCNDGLTLNGNSDIGGNVNEITQEIENINLNFDYLEATTLNEGLAFKGSISFINLNMPNITFVLDLYTKYILSGSVYYLKCNYIIAMEPGGGLDSQYIADQGFYCNPSIGCVDFYGVFDYEDGREYPLGIDDGYGNHFTVRGSGDTISFLQPVSESSFRIEGYFHVPENNIYDNPDYDSGLLPWGEYF